MEPRLAQIAVTNEDESLKIKIFEDFTDSKVYLDFYQVFVAAEKQYCPPYF
jgi:hypothetical protein